MKRLLFGIIVIALAASCKTSKAKCEAYSYYYMNLPYTDTIIMERYHEHFHLAGDPRCIYMPTDTLVYHDTLCIEILVPITASSQTSKNYQYE
jgi:hypothetical protein